MSDVFRLYQPETEKYNRKGRNSTIKKKGPRQDIREFHKYCRELLKGPEYTLESDVERLKMDNADVLEEYKFLRNAIEMICPLVFQAPNAELMTDIIRSDSDREFATRELAKMIGSIYVGNAYKKNPKDRSKTIVYDYKRRKKIPYKTHMIKNWVTGRNEKIVDIGRYLEKNDDVLLDFLNYHAFFAVNFFSVNASGLIWANLGFPWIINIM